MHLRDEPEMDAMPSQQSGHNFVRPAPWSGVYRRFGWAVITSAIVFGLVGFVLYVQGPGSRAPNSSFVTSAAGLAGVVIVPDAERDARTHLLLEHFVAALERGDATGMRADYPALTSRGARILLAVRKRLGEGADLRIGTESMERATHDQALIKFVVLAKQKDTDMELRLPFFASLERHADEWKIVQLR